MPWLSKRQERWGNSATGKAALGGQAKVNEWNQATEGKKLPEKVGKKKYPNLSQHISRVTAK